MSTKNVVLVVSLALLAGTFVYMADTYSELPDRIAIHFDFQGRPNGWANTSSFFLWYALILTGCNIVLILALSLMIRKLPPSLINIPWKAYWFANETRKLAAYNVIRTIAYSCTLFINAVALFSYRIVVCANTSLTPSQVPEASSQGAVIMASITAIYLVGLFAYLFIALKPPK